MPELYVIDAGVRKNRVFDLGKKALFVGRSESNDIQIKDLSVSRKHLKIFTGNGTQMFFIEDLNSTNGTFLGEHFLEPGEAFQIDDRDTVTIGKTVLRFKGVALSDPLDINGPKVQHKKVDRIERDQSPNQKERRSHLAQSLEFISKTSQLLEQTLTVNQLLERTLNYVFDTLPRVDRAAILLLDNQEKRIKQLISRTRAGNGNRTVPYSKALVHQVVRDGKAVKLSNILYEPPKTASDNADQSHIRSVLCVPMIRNSKIRGGIYLDSHFGLHDGFRKEDHLLLHSVSDLVAVTIEKASVLLN
jgi:pSer/pThr/pTyr-binding forkhead associated (FHA) protein